MKDKTTYVECPNCWTISNSNGDECPNCGTELEDATRIPLDKTPYGDLTLIAVGGGIA
jgi:rRNA maturation endonuclease Nob1